jgi:diadenosine tetraphosphate (Ap4A) HIT family hydrolase
MQESRGGPQRTRPDPVGTPTELKSLASEREHDQMKEEFTIHDQLLTDCFPLGRLEACHVLLHRNANVPWFILVPETGFQDLLDLPGEERDRVVAEAAAVSGFVKSSLGYPKVNFAAIGNLVPQLHLHVVGRKPGDACWPAPVWGNLTDSVDYTTTQVTEIRRALEAILALRS